MMRAETNPVLNNHVSPMLVRAADGMYWMGRYMERAEQIARVLLEHESMVTDVGDVNVELQRILLRSLPGILGVDLLPEVQTFLQEEAAQSFYGLAQYLTLGATNPNSLVHSLTRARENARGMREHVSAEMWEHINTLYWSFQGTEAQTRFEDSASDLFRATIQGAALFHGLVDQTMAHGQGWIFTRMGVLLERIDMTCRILAIRGRVLQQEDANLDPGVRNLHWMSVLRACGALEAYRRQHVGDMDPAQIVRFMVLDPGFPRTVAFSVRTAYGAVTQLRTGRSSRQADAAERILGRLNTQLEYADPGELDGADPFGYLQDIQVRVALAAEAIRKAYFL